MGPCAIAIAPGLSIFQRRNVYLHETGHCLGLAHSEDYLAIMYPVARDTMQSLVQDDVAGIQFLYGKPPYFRRFVGGLARD